jgi:hypothetical protein
LRIKIRINFNKKDSGLSEWFKEWSKRDQVSEKVKMIAKKPVTRGQQWWRSGKSPYLMSMSNGRILN